MSAQEILTNKKNEKHGQKRDINKGEERGEKCKESNGVEARHMGGKPQKKDREIKERVYETGNFLVLREHVFQEMKDKKGKVAVQIPASPDRSLCLMHVPICICCWDQIEERAPDLLHTSLQADSLRSSGYKIKTALGCKVFPSHFQKRTVHFYMSVYLCGKG